MSTFVKANTKKAFQSALDKGKVTDDLISFILDSKEIYTQGTYFGGSGGVTNSAELDNTKEVWVEEPIHYYSNPGDETMYFESLLKQFKKGTKIKVLFGCFYLTDSLKVKIVSLDKDFIGESTFQIINANDQESEVYEIPVTRDYTSIGVEFYVPAPQYTVNQVLRFVKLFVSETELVFASNESVTNLENRVNNLFDGNIKISTSGNSLNQAAINSQLIVRSKNVVATTLYSSSDYLTHWPEGGFIDIDGNSYSPAECWGMLFNVEFYKGKYLHITEKKNIDAMTDLILWDGSYNGVNRKFTATSILEYGLGTSDYIKIPEESEYLYLSADGPTSPSDYIKFEIVDQEPGIKVFGDAEIMSNFIERVANWDSVTELSAKVTALENRIAALESK